jgi:hypothetical protein
VKRASPLKLAVGVKMIVPPSSVTVPPLTAFTLVTVRPPPSKSGSESFASRSPARTTSGTSSGVVSASAPASGGVPRPTLTTTVPVLVPPLPSETV